MPAIPDHLWDEALPTDDAGLAALRARIEAEVRLEHGDDWWERHGEDAWQAALAQLGML